jgi:hypothetical protein
LIEDFLSRIVVRGHGKRGAARIRSRRTPMGEARTALFYLGRSGLRREIDGLIELLVPLGRTGLEGLRVDELDVLNFPAPSGLAWDRFPRSALAPREPFAIVGDFSRLEVLLEGRPAETIASIPGALLLRAPDEPGEYAVEAIAGDAKTTLLEPIVVQAAAGRFLRGDAGGDGTVALADAILLLGHLGMGEPAPPCPDAADADDSGKLDLADAIRILEVLCLGKGPLPYPGGASAGPDPTPDELDCPR